MEHRCVVGTVDFALRAVHAVASALYNESPSVVVHGGVAPQQAAAASALKARIEEWAHQTTCRGFCVRLSVALSPVQSPQPPIGDTVALLDLQLCLDNGQIPFADGTGLSVALGAELNVLDLVYPGCSVAGSEACGDCAPCSEACAALEHAGFEAVAAGKEMGSIDAIVAARRKTACAALAK